jgi:hypothetical protein
MAEYLYSNFLSNATEYEQAERLWQTSWEDLLRRAPAQPLWKSPWLTMTFANGEPFRDGNPIFSAVCPTRRLGIRVIQLEPSADAPAEFDFWTDVFAEGEPEAIKELVISCTLTPQTLLLALDLMNQWVSQGEVRGQGQGHFPQLPVTPTESPR